MTQDIQRNLGGFSQDGAREFKQNKKLDTNGRGGLSPEDEWALIRSGFWNHFNYVRGTLDEPTYLGFKILFKFNSESSPLFNMNRNALESANNYLINQRGDVSRAQTLQLFINELQFISKNSPWFFQSIEGLDRILNFDPTVPYYNSEENHLLINTLESVDMRIHSLMSLYRRFNYSDKNWTTILPENLRNFSMFIFVNEIRNLYSLADELAGGEASGLNRTQTNLDADVVNSFSRSIEKYSTSLIFELSNCEFDLKEYGSFLSTVSNSEYNMVENQLKINYDNVNIYSQFPFVGGVKENERSRLVADSGNTRQAKKKGVFGKFVDQQQDRFETIKNDLSNQVNELPNRARSLGENFIAETIRTNVLNPILLGNVYGFSPTNLNRLLALQTLPRG